MTTKTTIHLKLPDPRRLSIPTPASMAICVVALAGIIAALGRIHTAPATVATATPALPIVVIQKEQAPTATPMLAPTPDLALQQEVQELRDRVAELEAAAPEPAVIEPAPQVIYVAVATPEPAYEPVSAPLEDEAEPTPVWATAPAVIDPSDFVAPDPNARCAFVSCLGR